MLHTPSPLTSAHGASSLPQALRASLAHWQLQLDGARDFDLVTEVVGRAFKPHSMQLCSPQHQLNTRF